MTKRFIVRLLKTDGTIVANSQIITVNGIGSGSMLARDFTDGLLADSVSTNNRSGSFVKTIGSIIGTLTPSSSPTISTSIFDPYFESCCCNNSDLLRMYD